MADISTVLLSGRQVNEGVYKKNDNNTMIAFSIAVNRNKKDSSGNWVQSTDFFDCKAYGYQADYIYKNGGKGADISLSGVLRVEKWEKDGNKKAKVVIIADTVHISGKKNNSNKMTTADTGLADPTADTGLADPTVDNSTSEQQKTVEDDLDIPF
jgi:single-strand DNA-binding protein